MSVNATSEEEVSPTPMSSNWTQQNVYSPELGAANVLFPSSPGTAINSSLEHVEAEEEEYFYQVEQLTFLWVLFTLIVIGNATVLIALSVSKGRKSRMNFFIKNLAAADLCVGLISVLTDIIWKITISWEAGVVVCKLIRFSQVVVTYASTYVLVALSIDRYDAITHPMNFSGSWRRARGLVIVAWALSFLFSAPILHFYDTSDIEGYGTQCWIDFDQQWKWRLYMTLVSVTLFVIPAFLIGGCYIIIVVTIWRKGKELHHHGAGAASNGGGNRSLLQANRCASNASTASEILFKRRGRWKRDKNANSDSRRGSGATTGMDPPTDVESRRASSRGLIPKAKVKTVKMTFVIIFVFILCWSPYIVFDLLQVYDCIPNNSTNRAVATFIQSLAPLNSAANPLIYCLFSTKPGQNICNFFGCFGGGGRGGSGGRRGGGVAGGGVLGRGRPGARRSGGENGTAFSGRGHPAAMHTSSTLSQNTKSTTLTQGFESSTSASESASTSLSMISGRRRRAVGKNNSVVSWAAAPTDNNSEAEEETRTSLMNGSSKHHAAVGSRNSVGFNDF